MRIFLILAGLLLSIQVSAEGEESWGFQETVDSFNAGIASSNSSAELLFTCARGVDRCSVLMGIPSLKCKGNMKALAATEDHSLLFPLYCHTKSGYWVFKSNVEELMAFLAIVNVGNNLTITIIPSPYLPTTEMKFKLKGSGDAIAKVITSNAKAMEK